MSQLVLSSPTLHPEDIEKLAALANANGVHSLGNTAAHLTDIDPDENAAVAHCCTELGIDYAFLNQIKPLEECKILAMDMDSTLISIECIDEIADMVGKKAQVAAITEAAMRGEISDFAESLRRRVALLKGVRISDLERVYEERLRLNTGAERLIQEARNAGLKIMLVSGGFTFFTDRLQQRLGLDEAHSNVLETEDGILTGRVLGRIIDAQGKADCLTALAERTGASPEQIIALGDGANDLKMLALAHYSVAYRAKPVVRQQTRFALNVSPLDAVLNWFQLKN